MVEKKNTITNNTKNTNTTKVVNDTPIKPDKQEMIAGKYHYANMIRELFKKDPQVHMEFDQNTCVLDMYVDDEIKALAIRRLLPEKKVIADETVTVNVEYSGINFGGKNYLKETVYQAFKGNPLFDYQYWYEDPTMCFNPYCWVSMDCTPIFYPESNGHNVWGDTVNLPEDLACGLLNDLTQYIFYCSTNPEREMPDEPTKRKF